MAGEADEAALARLLRGLERLDRPAGGEDPLDLLPVADAVDLPEVHVVGPEPLQREVQLRLGLPAGALRGLGGEEDLLAHLRQDLAVDLLGVAAPVAVRGVEVVDAELHGAAGQRDGLLIGGDEREAAAGQADDGELDARPAESTLRDLAALGGGLLGAGRPAAQRGAEPSDQAAEQCPASHGCSSAGSRVRHPRRAADALPVRVMFPDVPDEGRPPRRPSASDPQSQLESSRSRHSRPLRPGSGPRGKPYPGDGSSSAGTPPRAGAGGRPAGEAARLPLTTVPRPALPTRQRACRIPKRPHAAMTGPPGQEA